MLILADLITLCVLEPAPARHSKSKLFLCSRLLAAFTFQFSVFRFNLSVFSFDNIVFPQPVRHNLQLCYARSIAADIADADALTTLRVLEPAPARHSKSKLFLCSRLLAAFRFPLSAFRFQFSVLTFPFSAFTFPFSAFTFQFSVFSFPFSV